jgi:hypothetical protein
LSAKKKKDLIYSSFWKVESDVHKALDNVFLRVKGFVRFEIVVGPYRVSLSGFFDIMGGDDDRPAMVGTQADQVVPDAADARKHNKSRKK